MLAGQRGVAVQLQADRAHHGFIYVYILCGLQSQRCHISLGLLVFLTPATPAVDHDRNDGQQDNSSYADTHDQSNGDSGGSRQAVVVVVVDVVAGWSVALAGGGIPLLA